MSSVTVGAEVGSKGTFAGQFFATMKKNMVQKIRAPVSCLVETLLPAVFIVGLIAIWTTAENTTYPNKMYISDNATSQPVFAFSTQVLPAVLCLNATNNTIKLPLRPCGFGDWNQSTFNCFNHPKNPVYGLCSSLPAIALVGMFTNNEQPRAIPSFDDMVLFQWIAQSLPTFLKDNLGSVFSAIVNSGQVHLIPNNSQAQQLNDYLNATTALYKYVAGKRFASFADSSAYTGSLQSDPTWATIEIGEITPSKLEVYLHLNRTGVPWTNTIRARFTQGVGRFNTRLYMSSGFLTLQQVVQEFYFTQILNQSASRLPARPVLTPMPYVGYKSSSFLSLVGQLAPLVIVMAFLYPVSQLTKRIVEEKETRIREAMMIMGLSTGSFYMSWVLTYMLQNTFTALLMAILLKTTMLPLVDFGVVFFLFWLFTLSTVSLAGIMGAFFSKSRIAALMAPVIFFLISIPSFALSADTPAGALVALSLFSPTAFGIGAKLIFQYEITNGFQSGDIANPFDAVNMASVYALLVFDMVAYFLLTLYFDAVMPSEWGTSKNPFFCFIDPIKYIARRRRAAKEDSNKMQGHRDGRDIHGVFEQSTSAEEPSVRILGLRKEFELGSEKMVAVNDLALEMYPNEITVMLGHNGAGKTTAINLMTGMLEPDAGDCIIYGNSVLDNMHAVRQDIGFCPQHNILWPQLTCREHLLFFAALKGLTGEAAAAAALEMLRAVDLEEKADVYSENLSGGQKRKLSVAIAFVGGNRIVFLDEPTAGMDVAARRFTWDLLKRMSQGRTIILTTHYMDEADLLGNQIAIMAKGRLKCMGSPMFLKSRLGVGYSLTIATASNVTRQNQDEIESMIKSRVPDADSLSHVAGEMSYRLPMSAVPMFPEVLGALEMSGPAIGVQSVGISVTTLEEIFLRIGHDEESAADAKPVPVADGVVIPEDVVLPKMGDRKSPRARPEDALHTPANSEPAACDEPLWTAEETGDARTDALRQFKVLLIKRFHNAKRDRRTQCLQIVTPIVCVLLAMLMSTFKFPNSPRRIMTPELYGTPLDISVGGNCGQPFIDEFKYSVNASSRWNIKEVAVPRAYNFSQELLATANAHPYERLFGFFCNESVIFPPGAPATFIFTNESFPHSTPVAVASYFETWARAAAGNHAIDIRIANEPLELTAWEKAFVEGISMLIVGIFILIPFTFIPSTFVSYVVKERECRAKHLQNISGMNFIVYWMSNFVFDLLSFAVTAFCAIIIFLIFDRKEYIGSAENTGAIIMLFLFYGAAGVAGSYVVSFAFSSHATAQNIVMLANFICGFLLVLVVYFLTIIDSTQDVGKALRWVFRIVPSYALGEGIINLATKELAASFGAKQGSFDLDVSGYALIYMACSFPFYIIATLFIDNPSRTMRPNASSSSQAPDVIEDEDIDVARERLEIESNNPKRAGDLVVVKNLRKVYPTPNGDKVAVRNLTFGVHRGEVFGFLGTNGAGKTTSISILCGEQLPTAGRGWIGGHDVVTDASEARKVVGYCPQFDALLELLTPEEHLYLYAGLRGLRPDVTERVVERLLTVCDLQPHRLKPSMNLSGGNKRKLSVAISLIGGPEVVFLDEPSAGMDPGARRIMWSVIEKVAKQSSVVLTTHHLEEVEVLSSRVSIMVDGAMKCIGSLQHLKSKFGSGFEMSCRVSQANQVDDVIQFITTNIPDVVLLENRNLKLTFGLPQQSKLSTTFSLLEAGKGQYGITDYAVSQTSLEQVFLRISADAHNAED